MDNSLHILCEALKKITGKQAEKIAKAIKIDMRIIRRWLSASEPQEEHIPVTLELLALMQKGVK